MGTQLYWQSQGWLCITAYQENPFLGEMTGRDSPVISWAEQKKSCRQPKPSKNHHTSQRARTKSESAKVTNYKMQKYMQKYFRSSFTFSLHCSTATSDCRLQTDKRSYDAHPSAVLQAY